MKKEHRIPENSQTFLFGWSMNQSLLIFFNLLAGSALVALSFTPVFPLDPVNFIFFSFVGLLGALYRPAWALLLLIGMLPYEIINVAPANDWLMLRPYQWLLVLLILALLIRFAWKRLPLETLTFTRWDAFLLVLAGAAGISALGSATPAPALKLSVILFSFLLLYFVCRLYLRTSHDASKVLPFLFSSFLVVACYAILQNILFLEGRESLEVMPGRPNATFAEADWLGGYLAVMITGISALLLTPIVRISLATARLTRATLSLLLFLGFTALIISVSRSAWLAAGAGLALAFTLSLRQAHFLTAYRQKEWGGLQEILLRNLSVLAPFLMALLVVSVSGLSPFDLRDRGQSVGSGSQTITVACDTVVALPEKIDSLETLSLFGCVHIRLEEVTERERAGQYVTRVARSDPNVDIRLAIYEKAMGVLREHWFAGIGFGSIAQSIGTDERGTDLNASNLWLEVWLGAGLIGFVAFVWFWFGLGWTWLRRGYQGRSALGLILVSVWTSATVFNVFNAGLFLAWLFGLMALLIIRDRSSL